MRRGFGSGLGVKIFLACMRIIVYTSWNLACRVCLFILNKLMKSLKGKRLVKNKA